MNESEVLGAYDRADLYEVVYEGRGKDYEREAAVTAALIRERNPGARSLLDVACGTGSHLRYFVGAFGEVAGVDLSERMLDRARDRVPGVPLWQGDMRKFDLDRTFDAVTCMFSSVGYLADVGELTATLESFARHLTPGGVVVVEPWWAPENFLPGHVQGDVVRVGELTVSRVSHSTWQREGAASRMEVHWTAAHPETGISHHADVHVMSLFSRKEYLDAFARAGFAAEFVEHDWAGPGLYVGVLGGG